ncbi:MAG: MtrB/PioB family outer membrane beta-barrel protein [Nitrosospira sp.]|nr:MtrB/PioB family outer membrane beta-barrel protein [Nitrosospira sp.]
MLLAPGVGGSLHGRVDTTLRLFVKCAIQKNMGLRLDYIYNRFKTDEWTWANWTYTDGTRLSQNPNQGGQFRWPVGLLQLVARVQVKCRKESS